MVDEQKLRQLAEAATPGPWIHWQSGGIHQIDAAKTTVVHWSGFDQLQTPNEKTAIKNNAEFIAAANPAAVLALLDELQSLRSKRTAWRVTAENAEAAVKQARIDALEEAMQVCNDEADQFRECQKGASDGRYDWKEDSARDCAGAIESLKGQP